MKKLLETQSQCDGPNILEKDYGGKNIARESNLDLDKEIVFVCVCVFCEGWRAVSLF